MRLPYFDKGLVHKRRHSQEGVYSLQTFCRCGCPNFLLQQTQDFSKIMVCLHEQGGREVEAVQKFCGEGDQLFSDVCHRRRAVAISGPGGAKP